MNSLMSSSRTSLPPNKQSTSTSSGSPTTKAKTSARIRYEDLASLTHVSRSTLKHTLKKLIHWKLVKVEWYTKRASVFTVSGRPITSAKTIDLGITPKLYDLFEEEDRALFLLCKRSLSPKELKEIEEDTGDPRFLSATVGSEMEKTRGIVVRGPQTA